MSEGPAAFWSYTHEDDKLDAGRVTRLAESIKAEFALLTGQDLEIFVDRANLEWGAEWRARIDDAVAGTTFFIPVVTPRYFSSAECRKELLTFAGHAASLGAQQLVLPILYVDVAELHEERPQEEVMALVASRQWEDWRDLRLADEVSAEYRKAVNRLASHLAQIQTEVLRTAEEREIREAEAEGGPLEADASDLGDELSGPLDILAEGMEALGRISIPLQRVGDVLTRLGREAESSNERLSGSDERGRGFAGRLTVVRKFAIGIEPLAEELEDAAAQYASELVRVDPAILVIVRQIEEEPTIVEDPEATSVIEFLSTIRGAVASGRETAVSLRLFGDSVGELAKTTKVVRPPLRRIQAAVRSVIDGQAILDEWDRLIENLGIPVTQDPPVDQPNPAPEPGVG